MQQLVGSQFQSPQPHIAHKVFCYRVLWSFCPSGQLVSKTPHFCTGKSITLTRQITSASSQFFRTMGLDKHPVDKAPQHTREVPDDFTNKITCGLTSWVANLAIHHKSQTPQSIMIVKSGKLKDRFLVTSCPGSPPHLQQTKHPKVLHPYPQKTKRIDLTIFWDYPKPSRTNPQSSSSIIATHCHDCLGLENFLIVDDVI